MDISQRQQNTTKGKLPHEKDPEPFKDEVDETLNRKFRNILLCWKGDTNIHEDEVDKTLKVNRKTLKVNRKTRKIPVSKDRPNIYKDKVDKTQKVDSTKGKLPLCMDHPNIYEDEADKTQKVNRNTRKIPALKDHPNIYEDEVDKTEKVNRKTRKIDVWKDYPNIYTGGQPEDIIIRKPYECDESTVLDTGTVLARMYGRIECEKELELSKGEDLNQKIKMKNQQLRLKVKDPKIEYVTYSFEEVMRQIESEQCPGPVIMDEENIADTDAIMAEVMAEVMARYGCEE